MDLERLRRDWKEDPRLKHLAFDSVEELAAHLKKCHKFLSGPSSGPFGYLYNRLKEKEVEQRKRQASGR